MTAVPETSIEHLIDGYDALLFDAYGVLVHLRGALPGAPELVDLLNRIRKPYYLVSNDASKLPETAAARFARFGLQVTADRIITSGLLLQHYFSERGLDGVRCAVLGPTDSARYVELAGGEVVPAAGATGQDKSRYSCDRCNETHCARTPSRGEATVLVFVDHGN